jgi:predicted metal-dependent peptidase
MSATMTVRELNPAEREAFRVIRLVAYNQMPYYAAGLFALMPVAAPGLGTFAVDKHWRLYMDPAMLVDGWTVQEAGGVLLHELGHLLRVHADRAAMLPQPYSHDCWNLAGDAEINDDLLDAGVVLPEGVVTPQALGCLAHDCAEVYYEKLVAEQKGNPDNGSGDSGPGDGSGDGSGEIGCGSGAGAGAVPGELPAAQEVDGHAGVDEATGGLIRRRIAEAVREAASSGRGTVPAGVRRWAEGVLAPAVVPWNRVLRSIVRRAIADAAGRVQFTYSKPSRRSGNGLIFPTMRGPRVRVSVVVDTSGSMSEGDLRAALSEIKGVLKAGGIAGDRVSVLTCDAETGAAQRISRVEDVVLTGGGGTDMRVGIAAAEDARPEPNVVVVLTDAETPWPATPSKARLVCVVIGNERLAALTPDWALTVTVPSGAGG